MFFSLSAAITAPPFREDPFAASTRVVDSYHQAVAAFSEQDRRIPQELAPHSGTQGENPDFNPFEVANVKKMLF